MDNEPQEPPPPPTAVSATVERLALPEGIRAAMAELASINELIADAVLSGDVEGLRSLQLHKDQLLNRTGENHE